MEVINIYTDGACSGNQSKENFGGWGTVLEFMGRQKELYGGTANTTNNRMELTAVIEGFRALKKSGLTVRVFTDSSYVANCFRESWHINWQKNGWLTSSKKPVENKELWQELLKLMDGHQVSFYRVKGHINLESKSVNVKKHYEKFLAINGNDFSMDDFKYIIKMNNIVDGLAVKGAEEAKSKEI